MLASCATGGDYNFAYIELKNVLKCLKNVRKLKKLKDFINFQPN